MSTLSNLIYRFNTIPIKIQACYFMVLTNDSILSMKRGKTQNSQHIIEEQSWETDTTQFQDLL